jgi:hypothetical protein
MLLSTFAPSGPLVLGLDDTIERRWGAKIRARGIYRDPVRSSDSHFVKTSGLRWLSLMLLVDIPWAGRVWALPFLTALAPSERYWQQQGRQPKLLTDWARQLPLQVQRWFPTRNLVVVADGAFASLQLLSRWAKRRRPIVCVTRLRLDARLFRPAPPRKRGAMGRPRLVGTRLPSLQQILTQRRTVWQRLKVQNWYGEGQRLVEVTSATAVWYHTGLPPVPIRWVLVRDPKGKFETRALLCTQLDQQPRQILQWFLWRWQVEVTFQEVRTHLGVETQRQWSDLAIQRTTPVLPGLFVFHYHVVGSPIGAWRKAPCAPSRLVFQGATHLLRCDRGGPGATVASDEFLHLPIRTACNKNPARTLCRPLSGGLLCGVKWIKSS